MLRGNILPLSLSLTLVNITNNETDHDECLYQKMFQSRCNAYQTQQKENHSPQSYSPRKKFRDKEYQEPIAEPEQDETYWEAKYNELIEEHNNLKEELKRKSSKCLFIDHVMKNDKTWKHYTTFSTVDILNSVFLSLFSDNMGMGEIIILYNNQSVNRLSAAGRPRTLSAFESFLLTIVRLRRNFDVEHLSFLFDISEGSISNTVITWANFMYAQFDSICIWFSLQEITSI